MVSMLALRTANTTAHTHDGNCITSAQQTGSTAQHTVATAAQVSSSCPKTRNSEASPRSPPAHAGTPQSNLQQQYVALASTTRVSTWQHVPHSEQVSTLFHMAACVSTHQQRTCQHTTATAGDQHYCCPISALLPDVSTTACQHRTLPSSSPPDVWPLCAWVALFFNDARYPQQHCRTGLASACKAKRC
jgi:hypothetical protein